MIARALVAISKKMAQEATTQVNNTNLGNIGFFFSSREIATSVPTWRKCATRIKYPNPDTSLVLF
ncbi:MAG: hypothetical protein A4E65_00275 [Syntrophorhabdus sp. PtaU1.Bin153]|nr:MAG: hypothetical protein A4E65_00275 [Syntrophorhabdus sp. PtaU1.Bin153]